MQGNDKKLPRTAPTAGGRTQEEQAPMPRQKPSRAPERGHRIKAARKRAGNMTQAQLAERVGVGRVSIARVEAGTRKPSMMLALAISRELGETVEALFGGDR
jgi:putative transcriptional regulator